jgi:hypothetical protein
MHQNNFKDGKVIYNEFNIDFNIPLSKQLFSLKEDLLQVEYKGGKYVLDVGWYPELNPKGSFRVFVVINTIGII